MTMFVARYDLRCPSLSTASREDLYAAAVAQASYCDGAGFDALVLSEHHGVDDGYLPSPLLVATAFATVTSRIPITIAALLAPLYEPLRLAEDIAVLDHLSRGRVAYVFGLGYRPEEYAMLGLDWSRRGKRIEETLQTVLAAWRGEPFEHQGRTVRVTPTPYSRPRPMIFYGGGSPAAANRAARLGLDFYPQTPDAALAEQYAQQCRAAGREPGMVIQPPQGPGAVFCVNDPDAFWEQFGHHLLHDARSYDGWQGDTSSLVRDRSTTVEEMREAGVYVVATPDDLIDRCRSGQLELIITHPLCGGMPPETSWESLKLLGEVVLPAVRGPA
jgi:alkanesulfonate monooxygenase SsuD/methylene tetrahydromethanopterin reductase-like flavin-dependent oxidoreductase (luciferase family)